VSTYKKRSCVFVKLCDIIYSIMKSHEKKEDFYAVGVTVVALNFVSALIFISSAIFPVIFLLREEIKITNFILFSLGGIAFSLLTLASAEILQIFLKIEFNTRKIKQIDAKILKEEQIKNEKTKDKVVAKKVVAKKNTQKKSKVLKKKVLSK